MKKGEGVALRGPGIRVQPPERSREASVFGFMSNDISAEINKGIAIRGTAREMRKTREEGEKIVVVAGPAIVHSAARPPWPASSATAGWTCSSPATRSPSTIWRRRSSGRASASAR